MTPKRTSSGNTGKSPDRDRVIELLRAGMCPLDVSIATGIPTATIKRWARAAGIAVVKPTQAERDERWQRWERTKAAREAYKMGVTAERAGKRGA